MFFGCMLLTNLQAWIAEIKATHTTWVELTLALLVNLTLDNARCMTHWDLIECVEFEEMNGELLMLIKCFSDETKHLSKINIMHLSEAGCIPQLSYYDH